ncbi:MAG: 50S ribosomal protein L4 [Verrucomicrobia bacterium]|nr:MAG: 50S ribosomal protein L4 [Verrucomicrobiota bacterium]
MSATILTAEEAKESKIELIINAKGTQAVHDVVVALRANRRSGTANTKTKGEVALSGAKPWRQKGTGRARAGYKSSPVWTGGGVAFGPKPRDYSKKIPKKIKRLALLKALSSRILSGDVLVSDTFQVAEPKTKKFLAILNGIAPKNSKVLVISHSFDENTLKAARNVQETLLLLARNVNVEHLLAFDKILITRDALNVIAERLIN